MWHVVSILRCQATQWLLMPLCIVMCSQINCPVYLTVTQPLSQCNQSHTIIKT